MSARTRDEIMVDPAGDVVAPRIQYLEQWIRDCQSFNRSVSAHLVTAETRARDLQSLLDAKNATLAAVNAALDQYHRDFKASHKVVDRIRIAALEDCVAAVAKAVGR